MIRRDDVRITGSLEPTEAEADTAIDKDLLTKLKREISRVKGVHKVYISASVPEEKKDAREEAKC